MNSVTNEDNSIHGWHLHNSRYKVIPMRCNTLQSILVSRISYKCMESLMRLIGKNRLKNDSVVSMEHGSESCFKIYQHVAHVLLSALVKYMITRFA